MTEVLKLRVARTQTKLHNRYGFIAGALGFIFSAIRSQISLT